VHGSTLPVEASVGKLTAVNPATGEVVGSYPEMSERDVSGILEEVSRTQLAWRETSFGERAAPLRAAARLLRERSGEIARLMATEMGKPVRDGRAEAEKCALACDYFADHADEFLRPVEVETDASRSFWTYRPLGVVLAVMPWNFPFWQVVRFAAPNLMAGNAGVLKHASNVPGCALMIEQILREAGFPEHVFRTLLVGSGAVREIISDPRVDAVTVTGSVGAGKAVAETAGSLIKKTVLELGGSDPYVVLEDADLDLAAETCARSRLLNSGQSCISAKRFIVAGGAREAFLERFVARMSEARMGDPLDPSTEMGPLAREDLRNDLHEQVMKSVALGAECVLGGEVHQLKGAWYPPTVLTGVRPGMPAYDEELFGPVAAVIDAKDEHDAIRIANDSSFGLGAAVFTTDVDRGERIAAEKLEAGSCFVNGLVKSDPRLPFGGIKESGYGRELSPLGIREFVNVKTVWVR
jgi:succinate-semialdehyde dehydrogenase/glutarate-semialdehyde dehydrogenase